MLLVCLPVLLSLLSDLGCKHMLYLYTGTPGSGKSLHVARDIYDQLRYKHRPVIANFDINPEVHNYERLFTYVPNNLLDPKQLYKAAAGFWKNNSVKEDSILLVIDEAQLVFNSRSWQHSERMAWIEFLSQHRHFGYKCIFIAQHDRMIDRQIRALVEIEVKHRKLSNFGVGGKLLSLLFGGKLIAAVSYYYGLSEKVGTEWFRVKKRYTRLYDSYNRFRQLDG